MKLDSAVAQMLAFPEAMEAPHFEMRSFRVRGKIFATVPPDGEHLHVFVEPELTHAAVGSDPIAFAELWWGKQLAGVRVTLAEASDDSVAQLLEAAWRRRAPKQLVLRFDAERS